MSSLSEVTICSAVSDIQGEISICRPKRRSYKGRTNESALADELHKANVGFYVPMKCETRIQGGRRRKVWKRAFGGLAFIGNGQEGRDVADKNHRISSYESVPSSYQAKLKSELIKSEQRLTRESDAFPSLQVGTKVCITGGSFRYKEGIVEYRGKRDRFTVRLDLFGQSPSVEIDAALLEVVE